MKIKLFIIIFTDFKNHFRITERWFEIVLQEIGDKFISPDAKNLPIPADKQLAITLWVLGNQESYRYCKMFLTIFFKICNLICKVISNFLCNNILKQNFYEFLKNFKHNFLYFFKALILKFLIDCQH